MKLHDVYCYRITDVQKAINNMPREYMQPQICIAMDTYYGTAVFAKELPDEILEDCGLMRNNI